MSFEYKFLITNILPHSLELILHDYLIFGKVMNKHEPFWN